MKKFEINPNLIEKLLLCTSTLEKYDFFKKCFSNDWKNINRFYFASYLSWGFDKFKEQYEKVDVDWKIRIFLWNPNISSIKIEKDKNNPEKINIWESLIQFINEFHNTKEFQKKDIIIYLHNSNHSKLLCRDNEIIIWSQNLWANKYYNIENATYLKIKDQGKDILDKYLDDFEESFINHNDTLILFWMNEKIRDFLKNQKILEKIKKFDNLLYLIESDLNYWKESWWVIINKYKDDLENTTKEIERELVKYIDVFNKMLQFLEKQKKNVAKYCFDDQLIFDDKNYEYVINKKINWIKDWIELLKNEKEKLINNVPTLLSTERNFEYFHNNWGSLWYFHELHDKLMMKYDNDTENPNYKKDLSRIEQRFSDINLAEDETADVILDFSEKHRCTSIDELFMSVSISLEPIEKLITSKLLYDNIDLIGFIKGKIVLTEKK